MNLFSFAKLVVLVPFVAAMPTREVVRDHTANIARTPASSMNNTVARAPDTQGNVFVCVNANFAAPCAIFSGSSAQCVNFSDDFDNDISSFGPDSGQDCFIFSDQNCGGNQAGPIRSPGIADLTTIGLNDAISSFKCFFG